MPIASVYKNGNRRDLQAAFDRDFASMSDREQSQWTDLLSKRSFNKEESDKIQKYFTRFAGAESEQAGDVMEECPLDYSTLDQATKKELANEKRFEEDLK